MKINKILFLTCISVLLGLSSCSDESTLPNVDQGGEMQREAIELAKEWYQSTAITKAKSLNSNNLIYDEPSWLRYADQSSGAQVVIDIDVTDRVKQDFVLQKSAARYKETGNHDFRRSYTRLVYTRNKETGKETGFYMTIVPSPYYTRTYRQRIEKRNTYLHRDKYLGGYVLYHDVDGKFVNGWEYKSGKVIGKISKADKATKSSSKSLIRIAKMPAKYIVEINLYTPNRTRSWEATDDGYLWVGDEIEVYPDPEEPWDNPWDNPYDNPYDPYDPYDDYEEDPGPGDGWYDDWEYYPNDESTPTTPFAD